MRKIKPTEVLDVRVWCSAEIGSDHTCLIGIIIFNCQFMKKWKQTDRFWKIIKNRIVHR
jgi:hypothetical protein